MRRQYQQLILTFVGLFMVDLVLAEAEILGPAPVTTSGQFQNLGGDLEQVSVTVRIPFLLRRFTTHFRSGDGAPRLSEVQPDLAAIKAARDDARVTWIGHATLLAQFPGLNVLTDPIWSATPSPVPALGPKRFVAPGVALDDLPDIDVVVISHNHYDHMDLPTLKALAAINPRTLFLVPLGNAEVLLDAGIERVRALDWGQTVEFNHYKIVALPTQHWSKRSLLDTNRSLWSSWAVIGESKRFYFAGDTGYFKGFKAIGERYGPFDLVAVPIGAYAPRAMMRATHMNPEEAMLAAVDLKAKHALAIHYGTFDLSDEPLAEPPSRFKQAASVNGYDPSKAWILDIGGQRKF